MRKDADYVLNLKLSPMLQDSYFWGFSKDGTYNSQSGYKFLDSLSEVQGEATAIPPPIEKNLWSGKWKVKTLPKICHFIWKMLAGALAVSARLITRGIQMDPTCSSCGLESESIYHALFTCPFAQATWKLSQIPLPSAGFSWNSVFLNLHHLLSCSKK